MLKVRREAGQLCAPVNLKFHCSTETKKKLCGKQNRIVVLYSMTGVHSLPCYFLVIGNYIQTFV